MVNASIRFEDEHELGRLELRAYVGNPCMRAEGRGQILVFVPHSHLDLWIRTLLAGKWVQYVVSPCDSDYDKEYSFCWICV